jgi:hypothetical protein
MPKKYEASSKAFNSQQMSAALTQMSEAELKHLCNSIDALQIELSRLALLLNGTEPFGVVTVTQSLLKILNDEINQVFPVKQMQDSQSGLQNWDNEGGMVDYAPVYHLLKRINGVRGYLIWTDMKQVQI